MKPSEWFKTHDWLQKDGAYKYDAHRNLIGACLVGAIRQYRLTLPNFDTHRDIMDTWMESRDRLHDIIVERYGTRNEMEVNNYHLKDKQEVIHLLQEVGL